MVVKNSGPVLKVGGQLNTTLFIVFLVLKLTKTIDWSWWWVFAPLWIPACIVFGIFGIVAFLAAIGAAIK